MKTAKDVILELVATEPTICAYVNQYRKGHLSWVHIMGHLVVELTRQNVEYRRGMTKLLERMPAPSIVARASFLDDMFRGDPSTEDVISRFNAELNKPEAAKMSEELSGKLEESTERARLKANIINTISDACSCLFYYNRKEDDDLSPEVFEEAIRQGVITPEEIIAKFKEELDSWVDDIRRKNT